MTPVQRGGGAHKQQGEKLSEYFDPKNAELIVRRFELQAILDRAFTELLTPWYVRAWRRVQRYFVESARAPIAQDEKK
jgi:hypothetical protein